MDLPMESTPKDNNCIAPPKKYQRIELEGLTEEQKQRIIKDKRNAYYREKRANAKAKREQEGVKAKDERPIKPKNMYFTIKPTKTTTFEEVKEFRKSFSEICQRYKLCGKETLEPRFAAHLENTDFCRVEYPKEASAFHV